MAFLNRSKPDARMPASEVPTGTFAPAVAASAKPSLQAVPAAPVAGMPSGPSMSMDGHADEPESVIGNDLSIEGHTITIRCKGSLRVNGNIQANLHSRRLIVGEAARISGTISAEDIAVHGRVEGSISGAVVRLQETAIVDGDIQAHRLSIDTGARFEGRSQWVDDPRTIAPQTEAPIEAGALHDMRAPNQQQVPHGLPAASPLPRPDAARALFTPGESRVPG